MTDSCSGQVLAKGTTDDRGLIAARDLPAPNTSSECTSYAGPPLMVSARKDGDFSFTLTAWGEGIRPYDFDLPYGWSEQDDIFHTVFDRTLVRQGETVHMKHIMRHPIAEGFAMAPGFTGTLRLSHRGSDTEFDLPLAIDANGVGETSWTAPKGAPMGDYDLRLIYKVKDAAGAEQEKTLYTSQSVRVDEYKLPTMKASVAGPKEAQVKPKTLPLDLFVGYLSGGGASNLPVELRVGYFTADHTPSGWETYSFGGKILAEGTKPLNGTSADDEETGPALPPTQTLPLTLGADGSGRTTLDVPQGLDQDTSMLVEMDYQDANGEVLTQSRRITLHASAVQLGMKTDGWLMKQDDLRLRLVALDLDGKPIANQRISIDLYSRQVLTARRRLIGGFYAYDNQLKTTKLSTSCSATTDAQGLAACKLDPGVSGEVYAVATTTDAAGNVARATRSVWLAGDDAWWFGGDNGDRMDLIPEKLEYGANETARFQVRMPFREATALVTIEREGVIGSYVTQLSGTDPVIEVPMNGSYAPDVYVSVMAVRGRVTGWMPWLSSLARSWGLSWFSPEGAEPTATVDLSKPSYRPRHRQGEGRLGRASAERRRQGRQDALRRARHRAGRRDGQESRRLARGLGRRGVRRGRRGAAPARPQRQLGRADRDDGRAPARGAHLDRADAGRRQAALRQEGGRGRRRRRRRRPLRAQPREFRAGAAVAGQAGARRQGPCAGQGAAQRRADQLQARRGRDQRRAAVRHWQHRDPLGAGPHHLSRPASAGARRRLVCRGLHAAQRIGQADARDRERIAVSTRRDGQGPHRHRPRRRRGARWRGTSPLRPMRAR